MAYSKFTTENARYFARFGTHRKSEVNPSSIFDMKYGPVDAVVLEMRGSKILGKEGLEGAIKGVLNKTLQKEDSDIIDYARKNNIPIYIVEPELNKRDYARFWTNFMALDVLGGIPLLPYTSTKESKRVPPTFRNLFGLANFVSQNNVVAGRNAVWARKLEEYIAPRLRKQKNRKPRIGLNIGLGHMGLEKDLKNPKVRDFTLKNWEYFNLRRYSGLNSGKNIGRIYEATPIEDGNWNIDKIDTDLFADSGKQKISEKNTLSDYLGILLIVFGGLIISLKLPLITGFTIQENFIFNVFSKGILIYFFLFISITYLFLKKLYQ